MMVYEWWTGRSLYEPVSGASEQGRGRGRARDRYDMMSDGKRAGGKEEKGNESSTSPLVSNRMTAFTG